MNLKNKAWKYATAITVVLIILNPEMVNLALFIDAVGLEMFLMLLEVQVLAILGAFLTTKIKPILAYIKNFQVYHFLGFSWRKIRKEPESLMFVAPSQATLMHFLVFSAAISIAFNACQ